MTLYGNESLKYSTVSNAFIFTIYSPVFLSSGEDVSNHDIFDIIFKGFNMVMYFIFIVYMLFAVTIALMADSYRSITIMKGDPLDS
jgi:hypothetical protein